MSGLPQRTSGDWMGTLGSGAEKLRLKLHVTKIFDGLYIGKLVSIDQGNGEIPLGRVVVEGRSVALEIPLWSSRSVRHQRKEYDERALEAFKPGPKPKKLEESTLPIKPSTLQEFQVVRGPRWIDSDGYNIEAKAEGSTGALSLCAVSAQCIRVRSLVHPGALSLS